MGEPSDYDNPEWPRYVRITDLAGPRSLRDNTFRSLPPEVATRAQLEVGDLLIAGVGATYGKSYLHISDIGPACFAGYLVRVRSGPAVTPTYLAYWTESDHYWKQVETSVIQATVQNFSAERVKRLTVPVPALSEQRKIVAYLDRETARIDSLIAKKERLLELLEEKRVALMTRAVTKGLDPAVPMKDSGVEWLGEVPAHWEVFRVRHIVRRIEQGWSPDCENRLAETDEWGVLRAGCVNKGRFDENDHKTLPSDMSPIQGLEIQPGDVLMSRASGSEDLVGSVAFVERCRPRLLLSDKLFRLRIREDLVRPRFLVAALISRAARAQIEAEISGAGGLANNIGQTSVRNLAIALPPIAEQEAIAAHLNRAQALTEASSAKIGSAIALLREYRTALISAAVTGQIDVRERIPGGTAAGSSPALDSNRQR